MRESPKSVMNVTPGHPSNIRSIRVTRGPFPFDCGGGCPRIAQIFANSSEVVFLDRVPVVVVGCAEGFENFRIRCRELIRHTLNRYTCTYNRFRSGRYIAPALDFWELFGRIPRQRGALVEKAGLRSRL